MSERTDLIISLKSEGVNTALGSLDPVLAVLDKISKTTETISGKMGQLGNTVSNEMQKGANSTSSFIEKLTKLGLAFEGVRRVAGGIFEEGLSRESSVAALRTLLPDKKQAESYAADLRNSVMAKLYGAGTVTSAAKTMMSFGLDSSKVKGYLSSISDIAGGNSQAFESLVLAFSQATSVGKLQGQDKLQMINAGFNPLTELSKMTGKSMAVLDQEMSKGMISAEMLAQAFEHATQEGGTFYGATEEQMKGLNGSLKSFQAKMDDLQAKIYEKIMPLALKIVTFMNELFDGKYKGIWALATVIGAVALAFKTYSLWVAFSASKIGILTAKQWLLNIAMDANPVGLIVSAIVALIAIVTACIVKYDEWGAALTMILGPLGLVVNEIMAIQRNWESIKNAFKSDGIIAGIKRIAQVLQDAILYPLQQLFETLGLDSWASKLKAIRKANDLYSPTNNDTIDALKFDPTASAVKGGAGNSVSSALNSGANAVTTGGTRNTSITISLGSLVHNITYQGGIERNTRETTQDIQEALLRVLNAAAATAE